MKHSFLKVSAGCLLLASTCCFSEAQKQPTPAIESSMASQVLLTDITKVGDKFLAVGERGHIIYSTNGQDWQQANVPVNVLLTSIAFGNSELGFATGHDATLLKTTNGGLDWQLVNYQPEQDKPLLDVAVHGDKVVAVGAYGLYFQSNDAGQTWQDEFHDELLIEDDRLFLADLKQFEPENYEKEKQFLLSHFNSVHLSDKAWYMVGEAGFVAKSDDQGQEWVKIETDYFGSYFAFDQLNDGTKLLAGLRGNAFISHDGEAWEEVRMPAPATINNLYIGKAQSFLFANSGNVFVLDKSLNVDHKIMPDGKAVMAGVQHGSTIIMATEAGIKKLSLSDAGQQ